MRRVAPLLALLCAACPDQLGQQCPPNTVSVGQYTLSLAGQDAGNPCAAAQADGGTPTPLTAQDGGQLGATVCLGTGADGGPQLTLLVVGKQPRQSDLRPDGGFHFTGSNPPTVGTACVCAVALGDTFDGYLQTTPPGPIALQADGGLPPITGLSGTEIVTVSAPGGTTGCLCSLPCTLTYAITGTRF